MAQVERIERTREGDVGLRLPTEEQEILLMLLLELRGLLDTDPGTHDLRRLFPPAYGDEEREVEYRSLMRDELVERRLHDTRVVERTLAGASLTEDELEAWLRALNDLRLLLGTRLGVTEDVYGRELDPDDPAAPALAVYAYLSWLQEQAVAAAG